LYLSSVLLLCLDVSALHSTTMRKFGTSLKVIINSGQPTPPPFLEAYLSSLLILGISDFCISI
jgi:hypothetical protein